MKVKWEKISQYTERCKYGNCEFICSELGYNGSKTFSLFQNEELVAVFKSKELLKDYFIRVYSLG
jgi:hypothetical protein